MRYLLFALLVTTSVQATSSPYYRFWRGTKRQVQVKDSGKRDTDGQKIFTDDLERVMSFDDFKNLINAWLIPATTSCCADTSLVAYLPALLPKGEKPNGLPDEVALIAYSSEEAYQKTRQDKTNAEAITYGPLHSDVFDMTKSSSLVPKVFTEKVDLNQEVAVDVLGETIDWQKGFTTFRVSFAQDKSAVLTHFSKLKKEAKKLDLNGYVTLLARDYVIEYHHWIDRAAWKAHYHKVYLPKTTPYVELVAKELTQLKSSELRYTPLEFKELGNVIFKIGQKPSPPQNHHRLGK